jgi:hypothetical protein
VGTAEPALANWAGSTMGECGQPENKNVKLWEIRPHLVKPVKSSAVLALLAESRAANSKQVRCCDKMRRAADEIQIGEISLN